MPKKKTESKKNGKVVVSADALPSHKDQVVMETKELEAHLDSIKNNVTELALYGNMPDLSKLTWEVYDKFKKGLLPTYFEDDEDEIQAFYDIKRKELIVKLVTILDVTTQHMLDPDKIQKASLRELATSVSTSLDMLHSLVGKASKTVEHKHEFDFTKMTETQVDEEIARRKKQLDDLETIEAEYVETDADDSTSF